MATALGITRPSPPVTIVIDVESEVPEMSNAGVMVVKALPASSHALYKAISVLVRKRRHPLTIARLSRKPRLTTATATVTAVLKKEKALDVTNDAKSLHL